MTTEGRSRRLHNTLANYGRNIVLIGVVAITFWPLLWMFGTSFKSPRNILGSGLNPFPLDATLDNYKYAFDTNDTLHQLFNSAMFAGGVTLGQIVVSVPAAYAFSRWTFRGSGLLFGACIMTLSVPFVVTYVPNFIVLSRLGLLNTFIGLIMPQLATGYGVFLLRQVFRSFPSSILEAATIDGAGHVMTVFRVLLPATRSSIAALALFVFINTWNELIWPMLIAPDTSMHVLTVGLTQFASAESGTQYGPIMAAAVLTAAPTLIAYWFMRNRILAVVLDGSMKG
ncbi:carbohydrate ABC transporter permease [Nocardia sp. NPDC004711]